VRSAATPYKLKTGKCRLEGLVPERVWKFKSSPQHLLSRLGIKYVSRKLARGHSMSRRYVDVRRGYLDKHLLPYFREVKLANINGRMIEEWITALRQKKAERGGLLSATTVNQCLGTLRIMLGEAERLSYVARDPTHGIEELKETPKERDILREV
jgi:hypothetical protein